MGMNIHMLIAFYFIFLGYVSRKLQIQLLYFYLKHRMDYSGYVNPIKLCASYIHWHYYGEVFALPRARYISMNISIATRGHDICHRNLQILYAPRDYRRKLLCT